MKRIRKFKAVLMFVLTVGVIRADESISPLQPTIVPVRAGQVVALRPVRDHSSDRLWIASLAVAGAASSMDAVTSWGKREGNTFLASPNGSFGARGVEIKAGLFAAVLIPQIILRNHEGYKKRFSVANFIEAGIFTGISLHNTGVTHLH